MTGNLKRLIAYLRQRNARDYLQNQRDDHLADYPQMCCYSFELIGNDIAVFGRYDREALELVTGMLRAGLAEGAVLDIGANIGNHAAAFATTGRPIFCFEPHPRTFRLLEINMGDLPNVTCFRLGASDQAGTVQAVTRHRNFGATAIMNRAPLAGESAWRFDVARLDDVAALAGERIALIKLDVEGHEAQALRGARGMIARNRPLIILEQIAAGIAGGTSESMELLRGLGYAHFGCIETGQAWRWPLGRIGRAAEALLRGVPERVAKMHPVDRLEPRNYAMLVASTEPIGQW